MDTSKIIRGVVSNGRYTVTSPIVKEDYGLYLQIEGIDLPSSYQVDFSNSENSGTSVTMVGSSNKVLIPREFIETGKDIFAFLYVVGSNYGRTVYKFRIPNKLRPDRTNEQPTPEEQSVIDQAISALNEAVAQTAQDVESADQSAQSAQGYAEQAEQARDTAQTYANNAQTSATQASASASQASASATASAQSASQSAQIKADVEGMVDDAQSYAESALIASQASVTARNTAQGYAQSASASAQSASTSASAALTYANTASQKATEASTSAQTASQKATEASQSASQALSYKTDAESAKTASQTAQGLAESARDSAVQAKTDAESAKADAETARDEAQSAVASIADALAEKAPVITDTASGSIASFSDGADDLPLKSLVVDIDPVQDLHGQDSPYPAGGGKNKFDVDAWIALNRNNMYYSVTDEDISVIADDVGGLLGRFIQLAPNTQYTISFKNATSGRVFDDTATTLAQFNNSQTSATFTTTESGQVAIKFYSTTYPHVVGKVQIELGSTATSYAPYENICPISGWTEVDVNHSDADTTNPTTITINLGQTVYGGKLDVLSGVLTVDRAMVDLGTLNWNKFADGKFYSNRIEGAKAGSASDGFDTFICSAYSAENIASVGSLPNCSASMDTGKHLQIHDDAYTDATAFKTAMSGQQLCYKLATPLTIQLDSHTLNSLYGVNNIWADSGDTEVEYRADTKLFIERLTAPDSADMIADSNITSGQYFMVGNSLYKATANIANGSAIIVGTNCTRKSLSEALNEINA